MNQETSKTIATFYKFTPLPEYIEWKRKLLKWGERNEILGTIILAPEGINATVSGTKDGIESFVNLIREDSNFTDLSPVWLKAHDQLFIDCVLSPALK